MIDFEGREIPETLQEVVDPKRTVLLVWDMQNDQVRVSLWFIPSPPPTHGIMSRRP